MEQKSKKRVLYDRGLRILLWVCASITCLLLLLLIGYIFVNGFPNITWHLLSTEPSFRNDTIGILPNLINTLCLILGTCLIVLPLGTGAAVYLTEYAKNRRVVSAIESPPKRSPVSRLFFTAWSACCFSVNCSAGAAAFAPVFSLWSSWCCLPSSALRRKA